MECARASTCDVDLWNDTPRQLLRVLARVKYAVVHTQTAILSLCNAAIIPLAQSQQCELRRSGLLATVVALDTATLTWARRSALHSVGIKEWGLSCEIRSQQLNQFGASGLSCVKIGVLISVLRSGFSPLFMDADISVLRDPLPYLSGAVAHTDAIFATGVDTAQFTDLSAHAGVEDINGFTTTYTTQRIDLLCSSWRKWSRPPISQSRLPDPAFGFLNSGLVWLRNTSFALRLALTSMRFTQMETRWSDQESFHAALCLEHLRGNASIALISPARVRMASNTEAETRVVARHASFNRGANIAEKVKWLSLNAHACNRTMVVGSYT